LLGHNRDLHLAFLDIEDRVGKISLRKNGTIFVVLADSATLAILARKVFGSKDSSCSIAMALISCCRQLVF
jgi:hypothetical protein